MKKNYLLLAIVLFFIPHCGYTPIYSNVENKIYNFGFNIINIQGNENMNNIVKNTIIKKTNKFSAKIFDLDIETFYKKKILTKNKEGNATNYLLAKKVVFKITNLEQPKIYISEKETKVSAMTSEFEFNRYEYTIQNNFINSKIEELIYKLSINQ